MKLVQKVTIGLSLACTMMLTSCSKEDVQTPEPQVANVNESSNLRTDVSDPIPWIFGTKGYGSDHFLPNFWEIRKLESGDETKNPSGTSTFQHPWGDQAGKWKGAPLNVIPGAEWNSFITVTSRTTNKANFSKLSKVGTTIRFLVPGKYYYLTFYVATARPDVSVLGYVPAYASKCHIAIKSPNSGQAYASQSQYYDFSLLDHPFNTWAVKTIKFKAYKEEMRFDFSATSIEEGRPAYAHLFINNGAVSGGNWY